MSRDGLGRYGYGYVRGWCEIRRRHPWTCFPLDPGRSVRLSLIVETERGVMAPGRACRSQGRRDAYNTREALSHARAL